MYNVVQHSSTVTPRIDIPLDDSVTILPDEGVWVTRNGEVADGSHPAAFPNWTAPNRTDVEELDQITAIFGEHIGETDKYVPDTYAEGDPLTISDASDTLGYLEKASSGDPVVAHVTKAPGNNDSLLEHYVT